jgi:hypothetical protein
MRKLQLLTVVILVAFILALPLVQAAETLQKPNVTLPSQWSLEDEIAYPNAASEHDTAGAGMLQYVNPENQDSVKIFYEKAPNTTYTNPQLKNEANSLFERDFSDWTIAESGTREIAGVNAGFVKGYDAENDVFIEDIVFVKNNYYFNALALYDGNTQSEQQTLGVINSVSTGNSPFGGSMLFIIIGVVAAVIVIVVVVLVVVRKKTKSHPQQATGQFDYPPPPPPQS